MKKFIILIIVILIFAFALVACSVIDSHMKKQTFEAEILEINSNSILVKPNQNTNEAKSSDKITVPTWTIEIKQKLKVGDIVKITYDGVILESYPAQINGVYKIEKVKK